MNHRPLGHSGIQVTGLCLGTMNFGGRTPPDEATAILDLAAASGVNFIDTANVYGHDPADFTTGRGRSEEIIGRWMKGRRRDDLVLATKMYFPMRGRAGGDGPDGVEHHP